MAFMCWLRLKDKGPRFAAALSAMAEGLRSAARRGVSAQVYGKAARVASGLHVSGGACSNANGPMKKPSRVFALLLGMVGPGLGQAYLGQWRRAALWAFVPLPVFLCYTVLLVRVQSAAAYRSFLPVALLFWIGWFVARSIDVFVI